MDFSGIKFVVVGSGLAGSVIAERIANNLGEKVIVMEKRPHIGGNCYSEIDPRTGIEVHRYGTHIFHTKDKKVQRYVSRFMSLNHYRHRVYSSYKGRVYSMPINLDTINRFYGVSLDPQGMREFLSKRISGGRYKSPANLEEQAISLAGKELYEAFIKGYTEKQWGASATSLPASIIKRLPFRFSYNADYFDDPFQGLPVNGYTSLFENLLGNKNIDLYLGTDFFDVRQSIPDDCLVVFTGPIDRYFDYCHGELGWRSLRFEYETLDVEDFQGTSVLNYADESIPYTRIHEYKHLHPERQHLEGKTIISREYSCSMGGSVKEPYYPVSTREDKVTLQQYQQLANKENNVIFCGRLGSYRYYDMDKTIAEALDIYNTRIKQVR